jgi:type IV pilus assembly protein PilB
MAIRNVPIGQILLDSKLITADQLNSVLELQKKSPAKRIGDILIQEGVITEKELMRALESRLKVKFIDFSEIELQEKIVNLLPEDIAKKYNVIPIEATDKLLTIASSDPMNFYALDDIRLATNMEIKVVLSTGSDIQNALSHAYRQQHVTNAADDVSREFKIDGFENAAYDMVDEKIDNAPIVRLVTSIIQQAIKLEASDIHIEPMENTTRVRMRVDGVLHEHMKVPLSAHSAIITRLKIMGGMNIAEKRVPQDGKVETTLEGKAVDLRLSSLPTVTGEKMVIRILGGSGTMITRSQLGLSEENEKIFDKILKSPHGLILVSGPTGSGKTTTLYTLLREYNKPGVNIITIEDPVEYRLQGINQVQINTKAGLTFASGLRSILRQDPNVIMVGEIRDSETAQIAARAAITGHLVLSTIHTNDAASTISRLIDMEIEPFLVSSGVIGIVAQRLVRKICPRCKTSYNADNSEKKALNILHNCLIYKGTGCAFCNNTGYKGRAAIHEVLALTKDIRELINTNSADDVIRQKSIANGMLTLNEGCKKLVLDGITTVEELVKVTYSMD